MLICEITGVEDENLNEANLKQMLARSALALGMAVGAGTAAAEQLFVYINPDTGKLVATKNINRIPDNAPMSFKVDTDEKTVQIIKGKEAQISPQVANMAAQSVAPPAKDEPISVPIAQVPKTPDNKDAVKNIEVPKSDVQKVDKVKAVNQEQEDVFKKYNKTGQPVKWMYQTTKLLTSKLKDPNSVQFRNVSTIVTKEGAIFVVGEYNAKNSFGAYAGFRPFVGIENELYMGDEINYVRLEKLMQDAKFLYRQK